MTGMNGMLSTFCFRLALVCCCLITSCSEHERLRDSLSVSIALPLKGQERPITMYNGGTFHVVLSNTSSKAQNVWEEWCSWGYFSLRFQCTDAHGKTWLLEKRPRDWTKNHASYSTLLPGESLVINVDLADKEVWAGVPSIERNESTFTLKAIYEVEQTDESCTLKAWVGKVESPPLVVTFYP